MIIDGKKLASEVLARVRAGVSRRPLVQAIVMQPSPATESYLRVKSARAHEAGMDFDVVRVENDAPTEELVRKITLSEADAIIVQLPVADHVDTRVVLEAIPIEKDADVLSAGARTKFEANESGALVPPVAGAVAEILASANIDPRGMHAVVVGEGWLVGKPCATLLSHMGAEVTHLTRTSDISILAEADLIVSGAGDPHFIKPEMIKEGVILIDAATSESSGKIAGDADPACASKCRLFTPVPGGVGPLAVAKLFENVKILLDKSQ